MEWRSFYEDLFSSTNSDLVLLTLNRLQKQTRLGSTETKIAKLLIQKMTSDLNLKYKNISTFINTGDKLLSTSSNVQKITNHPVHIIENNALAPSAFVPFCEFAGNSSALGVKINQFSVPVCNSFEATILNDQLCYQIDVNKYRTGSDDEMKKGLKLILDYNEDRQIQKDDDSYVERSCCVSFLL